MEKKYSILEKMTTFKIAIVLVVLNCLFVNAENSTLGANVSTNSGSGLASTYASLALAVTALNAATITSPVIITLNVAQTAPAGGYVITAQGSATNTIIIQGGGNTVTANASLTVGALNDAIFKLVGADYVTVRNFTMLENAANTINATAATNNMTEWGVAVLYATTTDGAQNNTIQGNTITLNRTYLNTFGVYSNSTHTDAAPTVSAPATGATGSNTGLSILANAISNVNLGIAVVGSNAAADQNQSLTIGSVGLGNVITDFGTGIALSNFAFVNVAGFGILVRNTANYDISYNTVTSSNGGYTSTTAFKGIYVAAFLAAPTGTLVQNINNNSISLRPGAATAITCIHVEATTSNATSSLSISNNDINNTTHTVATASAITFINNVMPVLNTAINGNTFTNLSVNTTGSVTFILNSINRPANAICNVNTNSVVTAFSKTGAGGTVYFYDSFGITPNSGVEINTGNNFSNMTFTGATTIAGWRSADGPGTAPFGPVKTVSNNTFSNIVGGTNGLTLLVVNYGYTLGNSIVANNTFSNIASSAAITALTSAVGKQTFTGNTITNLITTGASLVVGLSITGGTEQIVTKNKIGNLESNNATGTVNGISVSAGTLTTISNNIIGDLRTPIRNSVIDGIRGINLTTTTGTSNINVYNNTIALNATSSGVDFSASGIFHTSNATATTAVLDLRNNIIVNASVPNGAGTSVAFRKSSVDVANFAAISNNNDLVAPIIMADGTNTYATLLLYKAFVAPREALSIAAIPNFISTVASNANFLHINTTIATTLESAAVGIASVTDDFDGNIRQGAGGYVGTGTAPDVGADEFEVIYNVTTNSGSGLAPNYSSLALAITALNAATITSPVIITLNVPETATAGGYVITAQGSAANTIIVQGNGATVTASAALTIGAINDAIFKLVGADYVTVRNFTMRENVANTINTPEASNNMTEWGVAVLYASTTNGAQNNTVQANNIVLNRTYTNTFGVYSNSTHADATPTVSATATGATGSNTGLSVLANNISNVNLGIAVVGPTAAADQNQSLTIGALGLGNVITDFGTGTQLSTYANVSATGYGILVRNTANYDVSYNTVTSSNGGYTSTTAFRGIYIPAFSIAPTGTLVQTISNNSVSLRPGAATAITGIHVEATTSNATSSLAINNNDINNTTHTVVAASAIIFINNVMPVLNTAINGNTFTNLSVNTTGSVTFILNNITRPASAICNVNNNRIITAFNKTGAGGTVFFYDSFSVSTATATEINTGNDFSNMTFTGATTISGWRCADGTTTSPFGPTKTVSNNTFSNIVGGTNAIIMLTVGYSNAASNNLVTNNVISNVTGGGAITGITSTTGKHTFSGNTITGLTSTGASVVTGLAITAGSDQSIVKNKIGNIEGNNAGSTVNGILISSGTLTAISNNIIGDLRTPLRTGAADGVRGISLTVATAPSTINIYNNTIRLNATSTGTDFSSSGIFHTTNATATTAALDLRNNIIVNNSVANGTGNSVAFRRSATGLVNFAASSNNNDFVAPLLFADGTATAATIAAYQAIVTPREAASFSAAPSFLSTAIANANYLHIDTSIATFIESGGSSIASVTDDFDGNIRQGAGGYIGTGTAPDVGADEFAGLSLSTTAFDASNFSFYPNPTSGILNIVSNSKEISEVTVINLLGQTIMTKKVNGLEVQIDLSALSRAAYLVKIVAEGQEKVVKVLKQ